MAGTAVPFLLPSRLSPPLPVSLPLIPSPSSSPSSPPLPPPLTPFLLNKKVAFNYFKLVCHFCPESVKLIKNCLLKDPKLKLILQFKHKFCYSLNISNYLMDLSPVV